MYNEIAKLVKTYEDSLESTYAGPLSRAGHASVNQIPIVSFYKRFGIQKSDGRMRIIQQPYEAMKNFQRGVLKVLQTSVPLPDTEMSQKGKGIFKNAEVHKDAGYILKMDLQSFYDNCTFQKIERSLSGPDTTPEEKDLLRVIQDFKGFFFFHPMFKLDGVSRRMMATSFWDLMDFWLPTGAPTSPWLSNFAVKSVDASFKKLSIEAGCNYTRYLDDLTFSFKKEPSNQFLPEATHILLENNWKVNWKKSKWLNPKNDQWSVTGVGIKNGELHTRRNYRLKMRCMLEQIARAAAERYLPTDSFQPLVKAAVNLTDHITVSVNGHLEFMRQADKEEYRAMLEYFVKRLLKNIDWQTSKRSAFSWGQELKFVEDQIVGRIEKYRDQIPALVDR